MIRCTECGSQNVIEELGLCLVHAHEAQKLTAIKEQKRDLWLMEPMTSDFKFVMIEDVFKKALDDYFRRDFQLSMDLLYAQNARCSPLIPYTWLATLEDYVRSTIS